MPGSMRARESATLRCFASSRRTSSGCGSCLWRSSRACPRTGTARVRTHSTACSSRSGCPEAAGLFLAGRPPPAGVVSARTALCRLVAVAVLNAGQSAFPHEEVGLVLDAGLSGHLPRRILQLHVRRHGEHLGGHDLVYPAPVGVSAERDPPSTSRSVMTPASWPLSVKSSEPVWFRHMRSAAVRGLSFLAAVTVA